MLPIRDALRALTGASAIGLSALAPLQVANLGAVQSASPIKLVAAVQPPLATPLAVKPAAILLHRPAPPVRKPRNELATALAAVQPPLATPLAVKSAAILLRRPAPPVRKPRSELATALAAIGTALHDAISPPATEQNIVVAYAPSTDAAPVQNPLLAPVPPTDTGITGLREAIAAYRAGNLALGDANAQQIEDPVARTTVEWIAERLVSRLAFERIVSFLGSHPDWPAADFLRRRAEVALYTDHRSASLINGFFADHPPETIYGKLALARAKLATSSEALPEATALVRNVWLSGDIGTPLEASILREFRDLLTKSDHKIRSDKLFYRGLNAAARRAAVLAGTDEEALSKARDNPLDHTLVAALPAAVRNDPTLLFAKIRALTERAKFADAAKAMLAAPHDLAEPDEWWSESKLLARKLLDQGDAKTAYRLCAESAPASNERKLDAGFQAGWIALRFLHDPTMAAPHFAAMAKIALAPASVARAAYWQGRTADASGKTEEASGFYRAAAVHATTYYGQLARAKLGESDIPISAPEKVTSGAQRAEVVRAVELLEALGETTIALPLAIDAARHLDDEAQVAALAEVVSKAGDARATLLVGKAATSRGFALDASAFPTFGIPAFDPLGKSATMPVVYSIVRQESAFAANAVSSAGAMGLMQMIASTARRTAAEFGVPFDETKLLKDATFNAQLGAAHLGELLRENRGSMILTFAAYNAGGRRVKQWIDAYGDPRRPDVDPVDWVERIPIEETRNYVQRVVENLQTYRQRFGITAPLQIESDLR